MTTIATVSIDAVAPEGEAFTIAVEIGAPYHCDTGEWACPVALGGLYERLVDIKGDDSFQALCLAIRFAHDLLRNFQDRGGQLLCDGGSFSLESYGLTVRRT